MTGPCVAPRSEAEPEATQCGLQDRHQHPFVSLDDSESLSASDSPQSDSAKAAHKLLAAAGTEVRRFGEGGRIDSPLTPDASSLAPPHDSVLVAHTSTSPLPSSAPSVSSVVNPFSPASFAPLSLPSSVPSVSSVFQSSSTAPPDSGLSTQDSPAFLSPNDPDFNPSDLPARRPLVYPLIPEIYSQYPMDKLPPIPEEFTGEEIDTFEATLRTRSAFPKPLFRKLVAWRNHCVSFKLTLPLPVTWQMTRDRNPWTPHRRVPASPTEPSSHTANET